MPSEAFIKAKAKGRYFEELITPLWTPFSTVNTTGRADESVFSPKGTDAVIFKPESTFRAPQSILSVAYSREASNQN
jgi:hypothetical protein